VGRETRLGPLDSMQAAVFAQAYEAILAALEDEEHDWTTASSCGRR
jgi:hypothetical protein